MRKRIFTALLLCAGWMLTASAQNTIESIRKTYQSVKERIALMSDNFPEGGIPSEYYHLRVMQNLPGTGPHEENIRLYYDYLESEEEGDPFPPHFLQLVTAKYNFAAREFYEEYLYDDKGQVMFIYAITPDVVIDGNMTPYELRMWFDGKRLLRFTVKKAEGVEALDIATVKQATFKEEYSGKTIPEQYEKEAERCKQRALRFLTMFKAIDDNTYL